MNLYRIQVFSAELAPRQSLTHLLLRMTNRLSRFMADFLLYLYNVKLQNSSLSKLTYLPFVTAAPYRLETPSESLVTAVAELLNQANSKKLRSALQDIAMNF